MVADERLLAYVFWHWKQPGVEAREYEARQRAFHAALAAEPSTGFVGSFSVALSGAPWAAAGADAYEDWYLVRDFAALGHLNEAAVTAARAAPHGAAAAVVAGGTGGLYRLRSGDAVREPRFAHWFGKPGGMPYAELFAALAPCVAECRGALWQRQLTLGPATEFCLHAAERAPLPGGITALVLPLRGAWSGS
jgi:hypothetical protein